MKAQSSKIAAALLCFSIGYSSETLSAVCDVDNDGDVDRVDLKMIAGAHNTPSDGPGDSRDADGDGSITTLDLPVCIRQCSVTGCGILDPASPAPGKDAGPSNATGTDPTRNASKGSAKSGSTISGQSSNPVQGRAIVSGTEWKVRRGDTLYSIARSVFPRDTGKQARIRRDIMRLNPSVFLDGAHNMTAGAVLKLPDYVVAESITANADRPKPATSPVPDTITSGEVPRPVDTGPLAEPAPVKPREFASKPQVKTNSALQTRSKDAPAGTRRQSTSARKEAKASALVSLGYSHGGDRLVDADGSRDLDGGSGAHLRLGFEHMLRQGGGYRVALGLQYNLLRESGDSTTFRDAYLQLAYQYRSRPLVYGIGIIVHTGPTLKEASTREYDAAAGAVVYLENVGNSALAGWGLSYSSVEIEEQGVAESIDASRAELYYSWRF